MRLNKDDIYSLLGTLGFHCALLAILWFTVLRTEIPDEDGGVLVNFGNVDAAAGQFEPKHTGVEPPQETTTPPPPEPTPQEVVPKQEMITQDVEESVNIEQEAKKKKEAEEKKRKREAEEKKRKEAAEQERIRKEKEAEQKRLAEEKRKDLAGCFTKSAATAETHCFGSLNFKALSFIHPLHMETNSFNYCTNKLCYLFQA